MARKYRKIQALGLALAMISVSFAMLAISSPAVVAEDSAKPFESLGSGFPVSAHVLDQDQSNAGSWFSLTSTDWAKQAFVAGSDGYLAQISLVLHNQGGSGSVIVEVWNTDQAGTETSLITSESVLGTNIPAFAVWVDVEMDGRPALVAGTEYALILYCTDTLTVREYYQTTDPYPAASAWMSATAGSGWSPLSLSGDYSFKTYLENPNSGLLNIAWHESGDYALAVTGYNDDIWNYSRSTGQWSWDAATGGGEVLKDIFWHEELNLWYIGGYTGGSSARAWEYTGSTFTPLGGMANLIPNDIEKANSGSSRRFVMVGEKSGGGGQAAWRYSSGWLAITGFSGSEERLTTAIWDGQANYYLMGENTTTGNAVCYVLNGESDNTASRISDGWGGVNGITAGDWNPDFATAGRDYALLGGDKEIYTYTGSGQPQEMVYEENRLINDIEWHPDGSYAVLVGKNSGHGVVMQHYAGTDDFIDLSGYLPSGTGPLLGLAMKGYSSPSSGLIVGSSGSIGFYPSATDSGTELTVTTSFPHIFDIDFYETSNPGVSRLDQQVDVEDYYKFYLEYNYSIGGVDQLFDGINNTALVLTAWYDENGASELTVTEAADHNRTNYFRIYWFEGDGGLNPENAILIFPNATAGAFELSVEGFQSGSLAGDHWWTEIEVYFGPQMRAADGNGFTNGVSANFSDPAQSFDDPDSWNIVYQVVDIFYNDATAMALEEFGIFRFTNMTVTGSPSLNTPPGSSSVPFGQTSQINYSANLDYYVNVSIPDLQKDGGGGSIAASNINISLSGTAGFMANDTNSQINGSTFPNGVPFNGAGQPLGIWGNTSQIAPLYWVLPAPKNGTVSNGPYGSDFNLYAGPTEIQWWASVPAGTPEGIYRATITFTIGYY